MSVGGDDVVVVDGVANENELSSMTLLVDDNIDVDGAADGATNSKSLLMFSAAIDDDDDDVVVVGASIETIESNDS